MQKQIQTQEVRSCLRTYSSLQGQICTYWNKSSCNKSTCKYLHTSVACIQLLKITQNQEITIIISKQITLSPQEAGDSFAKNYKKSNKGITLILNKPKAPVDLKKIVRGNSQNQDKHEPEIQLYNFNQIRNIEQVEREQYKASKIKGILKHTTLPMEQISNPTSQSSSSLINEPLSPKNINPRIPQKLEHQSQIQSINAELDQLKKNQDQLQKELILLLSATNSSASSSKKQSKPKDKTKK
ncbi:hypothetical protein ABPG72_019948 [Tetrahymena utriculariae]